MIKVGFGYDTHRFTEGDHILIGGEKIIFSQGIDAHSDGDVLLHAICDALLGAAGLGDIGNHFPDSDPAYKDIDSSELLEKVIQELENIKCYVSNVDCTVVLERPKLVEHIPYIKENISKLLKTSGQNVNIKATTNEGMSFIGRGEGVAAFAVALLLQE